jgi:N-sulfoglucosamine sulfohydrolase
MYQTTIGAHNHRSHRDDGYRLPDGVRVLSDWMRDAGYFTANIRELPAAMKFKGSGKTDWNFTYAGKPFDSDNWADLKVHQPFFAQINFQETHRKFHAPERADPAKVAIPPYYPDHPITRKDWAAYLDAASELDRKIRPGGEHGRGLLRRSRTCPRPRQAVLLRGGAAHPAHGALAGEVSRAQALQARHRR